jgi:Asp-tRNA(Asn)/Glu-tRNA(Gln) amidotransferase A subunit family amidase
MEGLESMVVFPSAWSMDHVGTLTKTVEDAAILLDILDGFDEKDPLPWNIAEIVL